MYKKLLSLALALVMLGMASMAMAAPSITTGGLTTSDSDVIVTDNYDDNYQNQLAAINNAVQSGTNLADFFGRSAIANVLPGVNLDTLVLNEFISVSLEGVGSGNKDFKFATPFKNNAKIVVVVGIVGADGSITWIPLKATVANGVVKINFTKAALAAAAGNQVFLAVLSAS